MHLFRHLFFALILATAFGLADRAQAQYPGFGGTPYPSPYQGQFYGSSAMPAYGMEHYCPLAAPATAYPAYNTGFGNQPIYSAPVSNPTFLPYNGGMNWNQTGYPPVPYPNWSSQYQSPRPRNDHPWHLGHFLFGN